MVMLLKSLEPGRYAAYTQFASIRKLRSAFSNDYLASADSLAGSVSLGGLHSKMHLGRCPTHSLWFEKFVIGCKLRLGEIVKQDRAISMKKMLTLLDIAEDMVKGAIIQEERRKWILLGAFAVIVYAGSFQGPEVFLIDIHGLMKFQQEGCTGPENLHHVVVALLGRFKGETGEKYHFTPLAAKTKSGLKVRKWVDLLISLAKTER
eukprot:15366441-Ditylum_brightwellii.AAC.1